MNVLVAYATRHGSTAGIAERLAARLRSRGLAAEARRVTEAGDPSHYDAFVVGAAAYMGGWLGDATAFVRRHRALLQAHPTWLFSSGPIGPLIDAKGRNPLETSVPREFDEFRSLQPRGLKVFFGAFDPNAAPVGLAESLMHRLPAIARDAMPAGDFRDWEVIDAWADDIAATLHPTADVAATEVR
jgi:menaquinone-dependent protoporphyrinogen oxidase